MVFGVENIAALICIVIVQVKFGAVVPGGRSCSFVIVLPLLVRITAPLVRTRNSESAADEYLGHREIFAGEGSPSMVGVGCFLLGPRRLAY